MARPGSSPPARRRRSIVILLAVLGVLVISVPLAVRAVVGRGGNAPGTAPSAANVPAAPTQAVSGAEPSPVPPTSAPGQLGALPRHYHRRRSAVGHRRRHHHA